MKAPRLIAICTCAKYHTSGYVYGIDDFIHHDKLPRDIHSWVFVADLIVVQELRRPDEQSNR